MSARVDRVSDQVRRDYMCLLSHPLEEGGCVWSGERDRPSSRWKREEVGSWRLESIRLFDSHGFEKESF